MITSLLDANIARAALQVALFVLVAAPLPRLLGIWSPRARLAFWRALMIACVLVPVLQPRLPTDVSQPAAAPPPAEATAAAALGVATPQASGSPAAAARAWLPRVTLTSVIAFGILVRLVWLGLGLFILARWRSVALPLWPRPAPVEEAVAKTGTDAEFLVSAAAVRPMTFGFLRPVILVPADFDTFAPDHQKAIACHELLHVRRLDWLRAAADEFVRTLAWFHPAAWWLTGQIQLAREQVVDEQVVRHLGGRRPYLDTLLHLASSERPGGLLPASLFLGRAHLPQRIALLVKEARMSRARLVLSFVAIATILVFSGGAVIAFIPLHGTSEGTTLSGPQAARPGEVAGQAPARSPKPMPDRPQYPRKIHDVRPVFPPDVAGGGASPWLFAFTLDESGNVTHVAPLGAAPSRLVEAVTEAVGQWKFTPPPRSPFPVTIGFNPAAGRADPPDQPPVLIGGAVKAPRKLVDRRPVYPAEAMEALDQGVVIMEARVDSQGVVSEALVLRSIPSLDRSALEAVLGWRYEPRGVPISMTVTVAYTLEGRAPASGQGGVRGGVAGGAAGGVAGEGSGGFVRVGGEIKAPEKVVDVRPVYPEEALAAHVQGVVLIEARVGVDGRVREAKILRSIPLLDEAALQAVRQWQFTPTLRNGTPVGVVMTVTVNFTLQTS